jgi:hypothetical protein
MRPDHAAELSEQPDGEVKAALEMWRSGLVDLTDGNRLLNFGRTPSDAVPITGPTPKRLLQVLQEDGAFGFPGGDPGEQPEVLRTELPEEELGALLHRFYRRSRQQMIDRGVCSLYLAIGMLHWTDDRNTPYQSPILLVPVEIDPAGPVLRARHDDPIVNPALVLRMKSLEIELPEVSALADLDVTVLWAHIDVAIGERPGWYADETVVLSSFGVHRESIHTDLVENEPHIVEHPLVRALATRDAAHAFAFDPPDPARVDQIAPAEDIPLLLDADASQRAAIAAAVAGRSFVLDGPPGTGKSQTIANMVGCLLHAGKRVLVVSEKAAALDTVQLRLTAAGLGNYLLPLHSELTGRREVAAALTAALDTDPAPLATMDPIDRRAVRERRERLSAYAEAMNCIRQPLGRSLHDVIGICARLQAVPAAPVPHEFPAELTAEALDQIREAVGRLGRLRSESYLWRDAVEREPMEIPIKQALQALGKLAEMVIANSTLADAFDLHEPAGASALAALAAHAGRKPGKIIEEWLTASSLQPVQQAAAELTGHLAALRYGGIPWAELPSAADLTSVPDLSHLRPAPIDLKPLNAAQAEHLANKFAEEADRLESRQESLDRVTARLGLPHVVSFPDSARVVTIAGLIARDNKPEAAWFAEGGMAAAHAAVRALRKGVEAVNAAEEQARRHFDEGVLQEPIEEMAERLTNRRGPRKLLRSTRKAKKTAIEAALPEVKPEDAVANVEDAANWKAALDDLEELAEEHAGILGRHWDGLDTDFAAILQALHAADEVVRETPADALAAVVVHVTAPRPNGALLRIVGEARDEFDRFRTTLREPPARAPRPELGEGAIQDAVNWLRAHIAPLRAAAEMLRAYGGPTGRGDLTLAEAVEIAQQRQAAVDAEAAIWSAAGPHAAVLGSIYRGTKTNDDLMNEIVAWTAEARRLRTGHDQQLTPEQAHALAEAEPSDDLAAAVAGWEHARELVLSAFAPARRIELTTHLGDYDTARDLLVELLHDAAGQQDWFVHQDARHTILSYGLGDALEYCAEHEIPPERIWPVLERALYRGWVDQILRTDEGLQPVGAQDRVHLVEVFKLLDAELNAAALADIVYAVEARRPSAATTGEPALIRREGSKRTGHLAVRELIAQARHAVQALKPCLLMSPLAVSRLLPPEIEFDVVIIDEASQVTTADAINCVYRGDALITVGDPHQLPPTSFYDKVEDDVVDYPSILDLARETFPLLELGWHHRSRHEALFAFADLAYYSGRLVSLPRAYAREPDHGVQLYHVDGVYHRLSTSDNPIEAAAVADRVLHHLTHRPGKSLGVVTLSVAQADAISSAVEDMLAEHPSLTLDESDRLDGFFVKSLEAVQGDVRDVIILSVGYGYDEHDKISTNFGVLNRPRGWRRLNVAITRAAQRLEVVSSIHATDVQDMGNESIRHLKAFLEYAERDAATLGKDVTNTEGRTPFEESVLDTIHGWNFAVRRHIGAAGHWIDLGVLHPDHPDEVYALGIEFDGPGYHQVPSARDRDRLREQELKELGWHLHRVWSTAWYANQPEEADRLLSAIQRALGDPAPGFDRLPSRGWNAPYRGVARDLSPTDAPFGASATSGIFGAPPSSAAPVTGPVIEGEE